MTFFYNLNKKLDEIRATPELKHGQLNERDEGKPGKNFAKIAKGAAERYGSKEAGERVAGAVRAKLAKQGKLEEELDEGIVDTVKQGAQAALGAIGNTLGHGSDEDMIKDLQKKAGLPVTGKVPPQPGQQPAPGQQPMSEATAPIDFDKVLDAIAALYGDDIWENDAMQDLANDLEQAGPTDKELDFIIAKGKLPKRLAGIQFSAGDDVQFGEGLGSALAAGFNKFNNAVAPIGAKLKGAKAFVTNNPNDYQAAADAHNKIAATAGTDPRTGQPYAHPERDPRYRSAKAAAGSNEYMKGRAQAGMGRVFEEPGANGTKMTPKQKSFAALAEPKDKITFADKIAGAKKEVDEMLGDVAAEAMKNALRGKQQMADEGNAFTGKLKATPKGGKFKMGNKEYTDNSNVDEAFPTVAGARAEMNKRKVGDVTHGAKHDTEETPTGRRVTRRVDDKGYSVGSETDDEGNAKSTEKRGRGRPKSADKGPERVTAKATKHKGGRKMSEDSSYGQAQQIYSELADIRAVAKQAQGGGKFPAGFASRLESSLWAAMTLIKNQQGDGAQVRERKLSSSEKSEREDIVKGMKKNKAGFEKDYGKDAKSVMYATATKMAKERGPGNPDRKKKEKTEESGTVAGGMAPAAGGKSKGGSVVGKGIYDSLNRDLEAMINESMNVSVNVSQDEHGEPHKNITISAEGDAAEQLAQLLNLAGMQAQDMGSDSGCGCETSPCSCEELDENQPDWPTDQETIGNDDPLMRRYSGGVNGPKSTGQSDGAPPNLQTQRQGVMGENRDLGMKLYAELKSFKG
jgi:hypothetical protein